VVYLAEPSLVRELFTGDPAQLHAGEANATLLEPAVGPTSVLTLDDDEHMRQRKLLLPPFHGKAVERYRDIIREAARRDLASWPVGEPFGIRPRTQSITLEVILRAVYGLDDQQRFMRAREVIGEFAQRSDALLLPSFLHRGRIGPWGRFIRSRDALDALVHEEVALRRAQADGDGRDDVLSLLMRAEHDDGSPLTDRELRDELVTVVGAGHETTATALAWAIERLVRHPEAMERLVTEAHDGGTEYAEAVCKETLRLRPVLPIVARLLKQDVEIGGRLLPEGVIVAPNIYLVQHREDVYPEPRRFRPERFLEGQGGTYSWIPFGGGIRRCIGASFALYEMRIVLQAIARSVELRAAEPRSEPVGRRSITLTPRHGAQVVAA